MAYIALYRKWRPDNFKNLVGQEHVSRTLSNAITSGHVGHAYLFSGPRGTGKTSTAKILAKSLNCEHGPTLEPCGECESCRRIADGSSMDVYEIDAASNRGIDEIRDLRETVQYAPVLGRYKVYIIDEVHMLTTEAFNALLKTLEEPPSYVVFILATTESHKVPATIQSRCQRYDFKRITVDDILGRLKLVTEDMQVQAEEEALRMIALRAEGGMRDALSILDQCTALSDGELTKERVQQLLGLIGREWVGRLAGAIAERNASSVLSMVAELLSEGKDLQQLLSELSAHFRSLMVFQATGSLESAGFYQDSEDFARSQSRAFSQQEIMAIIRKLHEAMGEVKWSPQPRISVESVLLELCQGMYGADEMAGSFDVKENKPAVQITNGVSDSRFAQLEAQIGQLMSMVQQLQANPAAVQVTPLENPSPPKEIKPKETIKASEPTGSPALTAEWQDAWNNMCGQMVGSLRSCLKGTTFWGVDGNNLYASVTQPFSQRKMEAEKGKIEACIEQLTGRKMSLICQLGEAEPKIVRDVKKKVEIPPEPETDKSMVDERQETKIDLEKIPEKDSPAIQAAANVFGTTDFSVIEFNDGDAVSEPDFADVLPLADDDFEEDFADVPPPADVDFEEDFADDIPMPDDADF